MIDSPVISQESDSVVPSDRARNPRTSGRPPKESTSWLQPLSPDKRTALQSLHQLNRWWNFVALVHAAIWIGSAYVMLSFPAWPVWIAGYFLISVSIHALAILMHEGIHGTLFRRRGLDRWVGFLFGVPALFSSMAYKVAHLAHHRYNRTEHDPDEFTNFTNSGLVQSILFYSWSIVGMLIYLIHIPVTAIKLGKPHERRVIILEYFLMACMYAAIVTAASRTDHLDYLAHFWLIPVGVAMIFANVRGWAEHAMTEAGDPLTQSRTVTSNRIVSFLMCNLNYHLEHHLRPGIPWYNLPKMHRLLLPEFRHAGAYIYGSYVLFLWDTILAGVHGLAPKPTSVPSVASAE